MPQWKMGDLRTKKVPKRKGDLLPMRGDSVLELDHNADVWEVQKLGTYAGEPKWITTYFSLEDPNKVWDEEKRHELSVNKRRQELYVLKIQRIDARIAAEEAQEQGQERKQYHRWYRRAWRAISKPALPKAKVEKE